MAPRIDIDTIAAEAARVLHRTRTRYFIAGFYAGGLWLGKEIYRATFDIDVNVFARSPDSAITALQGREWKVRKERGAVIALVHPRHPFRIDLFRWGIPLEGPRGTYDPSALWEAIDARAVRRAIRGVPVRLARPEDVVALKVVSVLLGYDGKHPRDIEALLRLKRLDRPRLVATLRDHGLLDTYAAILAQKGVPETGPPGFTRK